MPPAPWRLPRPMRPCGTGQTSFNIMRGITRNGPERPTTRNVRYVVAGKGRALRVLVAGWGARLAPAFGSLACATCSSALAHAPAGSNAACLLSTAVAAVPGGSGACLSHFTVIRSHQKVVGLRPPLKGLNARPLRLAAAARTALLVPALPASAPAPVRRRR